MGDLLWGAIYDEIEDISLDGMGAVYICGGTQSSNNIATPGSFTSSYTATTGSMGGFLARFNTSGTRQWGTYYNDSTWLWDVACDAQGNIYVGGDGVGTVGLTTPGCFQAAPGGPLNTNDALLAKFNSSGTRIWATLYAGYYADRIQSIAVDAWGDVYIGGTTGGGAGLTTPGAHQTTFNGSGNEYDGLLVKFNSTGVRQWATYYSGSAPLGTTSDEISSVAVGADNKLYIAGSTWSTTGISTSTGYQSTIGGQVDAFLAIFDLNGQRQYGTYYGGTSNDGMSLGGGNRNPGMAYSLKGKVYLTAPTGSSNAIATSGAYQSSFGGEPRCIPGAVPGRYGRLYRQYWCYTAVAVQNRYAGDTSRQYPSLPNR